MSIVKKNSKPNLKRLWADPEWRARMIASRKCSAKVVANCARMRLKAHSPEASAKRIESLRTSDKAKAHRARMTKKSWRPESRRKHSESIRKCWQDPMYRKKMDERPYFMRLPKDLRNVILLANRLDRLLEARQ